MEIKLHFDWHKGMGTQLCAFSTFVNSRIDKLYVHGENHSFYRFKKIFNVSDDQLTIKSYNQTFPNDTFVDPQDLFKLYSSYVIKERPNRQRKYVGLSCYQDAVFMFDRTDMNTDYPNCKLYPIEIYQQLFQLIKSWGYDIITFDSRDTSIEDKADAIYNMCDFVIGYEGGIAHLAHMLDTPSFILPWRVDTVMPELLHLDKKTYFCQSVNEVLGWSSSDVMERLDQLNKKETNNRFLNNQLELINNNYSFSIPEKEITPTPLTINEIQYIRHFCEPLKLGGF